MGGNSRDCSKSNSMEATLQQILMRLENIEAILQTQRNGIIPCDMSAEEKVQALFEAVKSGDKALLKDTIKRINSKQEARPCEPKPAARS